MKLLSLTLQNINSLRSSKPIIIDFESSHFKDTAIYAITGATGAGKTTLLDAITIALYNEVPRFRTSKSKSLDHVVSYGAGEAFVSLLFSNKGVQYEAYWGMRVKAKNGTPIKPKEEVRVKNVTTGEILAEKKKEVKLVIEEILALNYDQFLRSVLLAQGEFASFLSAKGPEKAKLLEQITGEFIYKKIGETVLQRKSEEQSKLKNLETKIDSQALLTKEEISNYRNKIISIDAELLIEAKVQQDLQKAKKWFDDYEKYEKQLADVTKKKLLLEDRKKDCSTDLKSLEEDFKAQPFGNLISNKQNLEEEKEKFSQQKKSREAQLTQLNKDKKDTCNQQIKAQKSYDDFQKVYSDWQPKLVQLTSIEAKITPSEKENKKQEERLVKCEEDYQRSSKEVQEHKNQLEKCKIVLNPVKDWLDQNANCLLWKKELPSFKEAYTILKEQYKQQKGKQQDLEKLETKIKTLAVEYKRQEDDTERLSLEEKQVTDVLQTLEERLKTHDYKAIEKKKEAYELLLEDYKKLTQHLLAFFEKQKELQDLEIQIDENEALKKSINELLASLKKSVVQAQQKKEDKEVIWRQKELIVSLSKERDKLQEGQPCNVCGSTEHPYVHQYKSATTDSEKQQYQDAEKEFEDLKKSLEMQQNRITQCDTTLENQKQLLKKYISELDVIRDELLELSPNLIISNATLDEIKGKLTEVEKTLVLLKEEEKKYQKLREDREKQLPLVQKQQLACQAAKAALNTTQALLDKERSEYKELLLKVDQLKQQLEVDHQRLVDDMQHFEIEVVQQPIKEVLDMVAAQVALYEKKQQQCEELTNKLAITEQTVVSTEKSIVKQQDVIQKEKQALEELKQQLSDLIEERKVLLPIHISVDSKRKKLEEEKEGCKAVLNKIKQALEEQERQGIKLKANIDVLQQQSVANQLSLDKVLKDIEQLLETTIFKSIDEVKQVLLTESERKRITDLKEVLKREEDKLQTLDQQCAKEYEDLLSTKMESLDKDQVLSNLEVSGIRINTLNMDKGKYAQIIEADEKLQQTHQDTYTQIQQQKQVLEQWEKLYVVLGGSKEAFNIYVQRLTLSNLIALANLHLKKLSTRYSLVLGEFVKGEELSIRLTDHFQADQVRNVDTTSGGEKFIISLALALSMSDLASNHVRIDSLFIDEGFGTLDNDTLETVVSTLSNLQTQGKMIGIISHVESLKERITTQIQVRKKGDGISEVLVTS